MIKLSIELKQRRKESIEGVLYLADLKKEKLDYALDGDYQLLEKEKEKYLNHMVRSHGKCVPKELLESKLLVVKQYTRERKEKKVQNVTSFYVRKKLTPLMTNQKWTWRILIRTKRPEIPQNL